MYGGDGGRAPRRGGADGRYRRLDRDRRGAGPGALEVPVRRGHAPRGDRGRALRRHRRAARRRRPLGGLRRSGRPRGRQRAGRARGPRDPARARALRGRRARGLRDRHPRAHRREHRPRRDRPRRRRRPRPLQRARRHRQCHRPPPGHRGRGRGAARPADGRPGALVVRAGGARPDVAPRPGRADRPLPRRARGRAGADRSRGGARRPRLGARRGARHARSPGRWDRRDLRHHGRGGHREVAPPGHRGRGAARRPAARAGGPRALLRPGLPVRHRCASSCATGSAPAPRRARPACGST